VVAVGLEQLILSGSAPVWIGGDGSARVYRAAGGNTWVAPVVDRPDTLVYLPSASAEPGRAADDLTQAPRPRTLGTMSATDAAGTVPNPRRGQGISG